MHTLPASTQREHDGKDAEHFNLLLRQLLHAIDTFLLRLAVSAFSLESLGGLELECIEVEVVSIGDTFTEIDGK